MYDPTANLLESLDPLQKFNEDMKRITDPMYEINKALAPMNALHESMSISVQPLQEGIAPLSNSIIEFQKQMEYMYDPMRKIQEQMESALDPYREIQKQMDSLYSFSAPDVSSINSALATAKRFQESLHTVLDATSFQQYNDLVSSQMQSYKKIGQALSAASESVNSSALGSANRIIEKILEREKPIQTIAAQPIDNGVLAELESIKDEIIESLDSHHLKIEEQLEKIYLLISSMQNPLLLAFFVSFIFPIIINNVSNVIYDNMVKPAISTYSDTKTYQVQLKKEVIRNTHSILNTSRIITNYRIVTADVLNVRQSNSTKSRVIAYTFFGEIVEVVNKKRNWCLIRRYDTTSETYIQGWVFTRYLGRIR